ncbi:MAG: hypothetical protein ACI83N_001831 [Hydrogenophaga sp.]|jgi:hypothetical protein
MEVENCLAKRVKSTVAACRQGFYRVKIGRVTGLVIWERTHFLVVWSVTEVQKKSRVLSFCRLDPWF